MLGRALFCLLLAAPAAAQAQMACGERSALLRRLGQAWAEAPVARGLASTGNMIELLASADGSSWTLLVTGPTGIACVVASGEAWQAIPPVALGPDL